MSLCMVCGAPDAAVVWMVRMVPPTERGEPIKSERYPGGLACDCLTCQAEVALREPSDADVQAWQAWRWRRAAARHRGEDFTEEPPVPQWLAELEINAAVLQSMLDEKKGRNGNAATEEAA